MKPKNDWRMKLMFMLAAMAMVACSGKQTYLEGKVSPADTAAVTEPAAEEQTAENAEACLGGKEWPAAFLYVNDELQRQESERPDKVFDVVEEMPSFPGGPEALMKFLGENTYYPKQCVADSIQGRVIVSFVVERDGSLNNVVVMKSVHPLLDEEAVRVVTSMPKWRPGKMNGHAVRVKYVLPVTFRLD